MKTPYDMRKINTNRYFDKQFPIDKLRSAYNDTIKIYENDNPPEKNKTIFEIVFRNLLAKATKMKVYTSFWIGSRNVDLFIPSIKGDGKPKNSQRNMGGVVLCIGRSLECISIVGITEALNSFR